MERGQEGRVCSCSECREGRNRRTALLHSALNRALKGANEKGRRQIAALEAMRLGWGGISKTAEITGMSRGRITRGIQELGSDHERAPGRVRTEGGGRKRVEKKSPSNHSGPQEPDGG